MTAKVTKNSQREEFDTILTKLEQNQLAYPNKNLALLLWKPSVPVLISSFLSSV